MGVLYQVLLTCLITGMCFEQMEIDGHVVAALECLTAITLFFSGCLAFVIQLYPVRAASSSRYSHAFFCRLFSLTGAGEAGKTTIIKQMKLMHASGFSAPEREAFRGFVFANMVGAMQAILNAMEDHKVALTYQENEVRYIHRHIHT